MPCDDFERQTTVQPTVYEQPTQNVIHITNINNVTQNGEANL